MQIIKLQAENIKKLKAVEIVPGSNVIKVTGKNEQGKSTVLDAIWWALGGTKNVQEEPIRRGEKSGTITLEIGEKDDPLHGLVITRTFTSKGSYLKLENKEGAQFKSPQGILDQLIGQLSFDPLAFAREDSKSQVETLLNVVDIKIDTTKIKEISGVDVEQSDNPIDMLNKAYKEVFDNRTIVNRQLDTAHKALQAMGPIELAESVSIKELVAEKDNLESINRENNRKREGVTSKMHTVSKIEGNITIINNEIERLNKLLADKKQDLVSEQEELKTAKESLQTTQNEVNALEDKDLTDINNRISNADEQNNKAQKYQDYQKQREIFHAFQNDSDTHTNKLDAIKAYKEELIKGTKFPIEGLNFNNGGITYNGLPFEQSSGAQKLQVSLAIAMALNPTLRVIRVDEGTWLDSDHMKIIEDMAKENDFQIWMVVPGEDGKVGVLIEDGEIVN